MENLDLNDVKELLLQAEMVQLQPQEFILKVGEDFPQKRLGYQRCPVNLRQLPDHSKLPDNIYQNQVLKDLDSYDVSELLEQPQLVFMTSEEIRKEGENEIEPISTNYPRKRIGCCRCPVNLRKLPDPSKLPNIKIRINQKDMDIPNNRIQLYKYTMWNFIPYFLLRYFMDWVHLYYMVAFVFYINWGIKNKYTKLIDLILMLILLLIELFGQMFLELWRNFIDYRNNEETNQIRVKILNRNGLIEEITSSKLRVGQIIKIENNEAIPADIVILSTSSKNGSNKIKMQQITFLGVCFVNTPNDGEMKLIQKSAHQEIISFFRKNGEGKQETLMSQSIMLFNYQKPNKDYNNFKGNNSQNINMIFLGHIAFVNEKIKVRMHGCSFITRESVLRDTRYIYGVIVYTGHYSKFMISAFKKEDKKQKTEVILQRQLKNYFIFSLVLFSISLILFSISYKYLSFLGWDGVLAQSLILTLWIIPFWLGFVKKIITWFVRRKIQDHKTISINSDQHSDLGQISYIFSDKTGTLTTNEMHIKFCCVKGISYGNEQTLEKITIFPHRKKIKNVIFNDVKFIQILNNKKEPQHKNVLQYFNLFPVSYIQRDFVTILALCNSTCKYDNAREHQADYVIIYYLYTIKIFQISKTYVSPQDKDTALINFTKYCGMKSQIQGKNVKIIFNDTQEKIFKIIHSFELKSARNRTTVILKNENNQILLLCKGTDSELIKLLKTPIDKNSYEELQKYYDQGLRVLVIAYKIIPNQQYQEWDQMYQDIWLKGQQFNLEQQKMIQLEKIEHDLVFIGITAVEDELQEDTQFSVTKLKQAGIRFWLLTGDKIETTLQIAEKSKMLTNIFGQVQIIGNENAVISREMDESLDLLKIGTHEDNRKEEIYEEVKSFLQHNFALIVSGDSLKFIFQDVILKKKFIKITYLCQVIIGVRFEEQQKTQVVKMIMRQYPDLCTMAIADSPNDLGLIYEANVSLGIYTLKSKLMKNIPHYAVNDFKKLPRLLLSQGTEAIRKMTLMILITFYMSFSLVISVVLLILFKVFFYPNLVIWRISLTSNFFQFLFLFTFGLYFAIFDQQFGEAHLINNSYLYAKGRVGKVFNWKALWFCILWAGFSTFFIVFITLVFLNNDCFYVSFIINCFTFTSFNNKWLLISKKSIFGCLLFTLSFYYIITWNYYWGGKYKNYNFLKGILRISDTCGIPRTKIYTITTIIFILDILTFLCFQTYMKCHQNVTESRIRNITQWKDSYDIDVKANCPYKHGLKKLKIQKKTPYRCAVCSKWFNDYYVFIWRCKQCNYNVCRDCAQMSPVSQELKVVEVGKGLRSFTFSQNFFFYLISKVNEKMRSTLNMILLFDFNELTHEFLYFSSFLQCFNSQISYSLHFIVILL